MKSFIHKLYLVLCPLVLFVACNDDSYLGGHSTTEGAGVQAKVTAVSVSEQTPAITWSEGDCIALTTSYADSYSLNRIYQSGADGRTFTVQTGLPLYIKGNGTISAYAPVVGYDGTEPVIELSTTDQSAITDFIFATEEISRSSADVQLRFRRFHSKLHTTIKTADIEHIRKVVLSGFSHEASVDPYTWTVTSASAAADYSLISATDITSFDLTLIPQTIAADAVVPAQITLIGLNRSYELLLGNISLESDITLSMAIDVSTPEPTIAFSTDGVTWTNYEDKQSDGIGFDPSNDDSPWTNFEDKQENAATFVTDTVRWADSEAGGDVLS